MWWWLHGVAEELDLRCLPVRKTHGKAVSLCKTAGASQWTPCVWGRSLLTRPLRTSTQVPTLNGHNGKVALAVGGFTSSPFLCLNPSEKGLDVIAGLALTM